MNECFRLHKKLKMLQLKKDYATIKDSNGRNRNVSKSDNRSLTADSKDEAISTMRGDQVNIIVNNNSLKEQPSPKKSPTGK